MDKELAALKEELCKASELVKTEVEKIAQKGDLTPGELESLYKAACFAKELECLKSGDAETNYWPDGMSGRRYDVHMNTYGEPYGYSEARGRSPVTGRYISRGMDGYSGHSIEDRMIAALEQQMDNAKSEYEKQQILEEIKHIRMGTR